MKLTDEELVRKFPALVNCDRYKAVAEVCDECLMYECVKLAQEEYRKSGKMQTRSDVLRAYMSFKFGDEYNFLDLLNGCMLMQYVGETLLEMLAVERAKWN